MRSCQIIIVLISLAVMLLTISFAIFYCLVILLVSGFVMYSTFVQVLRI